MWAMHLHISGRMAIRSISLCRVGQLQWCDCYILDIAEQRSKLQTKIRKSHLYLIRTLLISPHVVPSWGTAMISAYLGHTLKPRGFSKHTGLAVFEIPNLISSVPSIFVLGRTQADEASAKTAYLPVAVFSPWPYLTASYCHQRYIYLWGVFFFFFLISF